ncbi:fatty-acid amide hydrolase 1-like [Liolophura sinensis]|uniref:fatty-acid amide hydrolase 1-like n=1 Tax=Liolophura sinensis TaxID=3198878 RepID=UPI0031594042
MKSLEEWFNSLEFDLTENQKYAAGGCCVVAVIFVWSFHKKRHLDHKKNEKKRKIKEKREQYAASFEQLRNSLSNLSSADEDVTCLSLKELTTRLQNDELKPIQVLRAFQKKALKITESLNCIQTPICEAEAWAQALCLRSEKGPLYGIPVSIKDHIPIKGYDTTIGGCTSTLGKPYPDDSVIIKVLKKQGAIPFVFTNVPQTLFCASCINPVFGRTKNPFNPNCTSGGSSGGEAALIATKGSVLGFGTDIGGSIRIPSAFCGICGLKPTAGRLSVKGFPSFYSGETAIENTLGPMARDVETLALTMKALLVPYHWELDPTIAPLPFQDQVYQGMRPLKIGILHDNKIYPAIPACIRGVDLAAEALQKLGHTVIPYEFPDVDTLYYLMTRGYFGDEGRTFLELLDGDEAISPLRPAQLILSLPRLVRRIVIGLVKLMMSEDDQKTLPPDGILGFSSVYEWWEFVAKSKAYRHLVIDDWRKLGIDALICPVAACVALPDKLTEKAGYAFSYSSMFNVLNFPVGIVPVTKVTQEDQQRMSEYPAKGSMQNLLKQHFMDGGIGLPVAVQCVGLPFQEELVLRVQKDIQNRLKAW